MKPGNCALWILLTLLGLSSGLAATTAQLMLRNDDRADHTMAALAVCAPAAVLLWAGHRATSSVTEERLDFGQWLWRIAARGRTLVLAVLLSLGGFLLPRSIVENTQGWEWAVDVVVLLGAAAIIMVIANVAFRSAVPDDASRLRHDDDRPPRT